MCVSARVRGHQSLDVHQGKADGSEQGWLPYTGLHCVTSCECVLLQCRCQGIVLAECTTLSKQYIGSLQEVATLQFTLVTIPVQSLVSAAHYIIQIVSP